MPSSFPLHRSESSRTTSRFHGELQPWKIFELHVRDNFHTPKQAIKRTLSSSDIGPSILLQDTYPEDLTASFGGRVRLKPEYELKKRFPNGGSGYMERAYVDARADMYHNSRFKDIGQPDYYQNSTDDYFHMYRPWRVHLPPTYASTWQHRYENVIGTNLDKSAALLEARRGDYHIDILSGDYRSPTYWNGRFGNGQSIVPYVRNPWFLTPEYYKHSRKGY